MTDKERKDCDDFILQLVGVKNLAFKVGMYATGQILDNATTKAGWELADKIAKEAHNV